MFYYVSCNLLDMELWALLEVHAIDILYYACLNIYHIYNNLYIY